MFTNALVVKCKHWALEIVVDVGNPCQMFYHILEFFIFLEVKETKRIFLPWQRQCDPQISDKQGSYPQLRQIGSFVDIGFLKVVKQVIMYKIKWQRIIYSCRYKNNQADYTYYTPSSDCTTAAAITPITTQILIIIFINRFVFMNNYFGVIKKT